MFAYLSCALSICLAALYAEKRTTLPERHALLARRTFVSSYVPLEADSSAACEAAPTLVHCRKQIMAKDIDPDRPGRDGAEMPRSRRTQKLRVPVIAARVSLACPTSRCASP